MTSALGGLRVLDLSRLLPGPYMTQMLADLGAEVIKVEDPNGGDYLRHLPPRVGHNDDVNVVFAAIHRGKRSVALDLKADADKQAFLDLCTSADILVESFRPGVMERLALGPEDLRAIAPKLIYCRISGYGQGSDPDQARAGHDLNYVARAGLLGLTSAPQVPPAQIADLVGGAMLPTIQILAALRLRDQTGQGCTIDAALIDGAWALQIWPLARGLGAQQHSLPGDEILYGGVPAYACYPTQDGALAVAALEPKYWEPLVRALGRQDLQHDGLSKGARGDQVQAELHNIFATRSTQAWMALLGPLDCCVEPVRSPEQAAIAEPAFQRFQFVDDVDINGQTVRLPLSPLRVGPDSRPRQGPPSLGEGNADLLHKSET